MPWRRKWQPTPVFLTGKSHGQRRLAGYSSWGCKNVRHDLAIKWESEYLPQRVPLRPQWDNTFIGRSEQCQQTGSAPQALGALTTKAVSSLRAGTLHLFRPHLTFSACLAQPLACPFSAECQAPTAPVQVGVRRHTLFAPLPRPVGEASPGHQELPPRPSHGTRASGCCWTSTYSTQRWSSKAKTTRG